MLYAQKIKESIHNIDKGIEDAQRLMVSLTKTRRNLQSICPHSWEKCNSVGSVRCEFCQSYLTSSAYKRVTESQE